MKTRVALTAQAIRKELKVAYPNTKFHVRSENYSGGNSIHVDYIQTLEAPREKEVKTLLSKYEGGHFDVMTDMYEYKSDVGSLTTKYLFVNADIDGLRSEYKADFMKYWGLTSEDDAECMKRTGRWFFESLSNYVRTVVLGKKDENIIVATIA